MAKSLTELSDADLVSELAEAKRDLHALRFQNATGELENTSRLSQVRRSIARLMTEQRAREIAAEATTGASS